MVYFPEGEHLHSVIIEERVFHAYTHLKNTSYFELHVVLTSLSMTMFII
jgi:hypothetical protein